MMSHYVADTFTQSEGAFEVMHLALGGQPVSCRNSKATSVRAETKPQSFINLAKLEIKLLSLQPQYGSSVI